MKLSLFFPFFSTTLEMEISTYFSLKSRKYNFFFYILILIQALFPDFSDICALPSDQTSFHSASLCPIFSCSLSFRFVLCK